MILGVLKEGEAERRTSVLPEHISLLKKAGIEKVNVESGTGRTVNTTDRQYQDAEAEILSRQELITNSDLLSCIHLPDDVSGMKGKTLITQMNPLANPDQVNKLKEEGMTVFSLDMVPRTTKAQAMDVLSSMATAAGYKAVLHAANILPKFFPMFMTAAGTIAPSKVLVLGAGVAGLQAISTARRLGAVVEAFDVRAAAKEEVLSLGAKFVEVEGAKDDASAGGYAVEQTEEYKQKQAALIQEHAAKADVVICTAQIPGRRAPLLIQEDTLKKMKPGSVIIDMAASTGGNCAMTRENETIFVHGITIVGDSNLASGIPMDASKMYGKNLVNFLNEILSEDGISFDFENEIIQHSCVCHEGKIISPRLIKSIS